MQRIRQNQRLAALAVVMVVMVCSVSVRSLELNTIKVCTNKVCRRDHSERTLRTFEDISPPHLTVSSCGCRGNCGSGPNVEIANEVGVRDVKSKVTEAATAAALLSISFGVDVPDPVVEAYGKLLEAERWSDSLTNHEGVCTLNRLKPQMSALVTFIHSLLSLHALITVNDRIRSNQHTG